MADIPYSISANVTTVDLNTLINSLLQQSSEEIPIADFDFLIFDECIRTTLNEHLREKAISFEDVIVIEYVERFPAPEPQDCLLHDDWVSAVHTKGSWILTGCYDNTVNIWTTKGKHILTIPGHTMPVKAVSWVSLDDIQGTFVTCSQDQTAMIWQWNIGSNSVECISVCKGHERAIDSINVSPDGQRFATGSWDTMLKVWSTDFSDVEASVEPKRSKKDCGSTKTPKMTLQGHRESVSAVQWMDNETIVTGSYDHTIKVWDLHLEGIKTEISGNKAFFDINYSPLNNLIIAASADKNLRIYDTRLKGGNVVRNTYLGHTKWIQTVTWSTDDQFLFTSGSYDNQVKLWDHRSPKAPLYDLIGHTDKVLDIDWSNPKFVVSGGCDNSVRVFKTRKPGQEVEED